MKHELVYDMIERKTDVQNFYRADLERIAKTNVPFDKLSGIVILGAPSVPLSMADRSVKSVLADIMEERPGEGHILTGGEWRTWLAAQLSEELGQKMPFYILGGKQTYQYSENGVQQQVVHSRASVMKDSMIKFGVLPEMIEDITTEGNTIGNFKGLRERFKSTICLDGRRHDYAYSTNWLQAPRTELFFQYHPEFTWFRENNIHFHPIPTEPMILSRGGEFADRVSYALQTPAALKRILMEMQGIDMMLKGEYNPLSG